MIAIRSVRLHGPHGISEHADGVAPAIPGPALARTIADTVPITRIMSPQVVCARPDLGLQAVIEIMVRERLGCLPIVDERLHPLGMVTKLDIVEHLVGPPDRVMPQVSDVMMPFAITLDEDATVAHAAALMASEDMHHVMIVSDRRLIGVVSTMDVTRWLAGNDGMPS